jgi:Protein of unknown function (DUF3147)
MTIRIDIGGLRRTRWYEYAIRFLFGGLITAAAGLIAERWGPAIGGLFLAFPAIFPASVTLVEEHERQKKTRVGLHGAVRGREAAALDAAGAAIGCIGLAGFALTVWQFLPLGQTWMVLGSAGLLWLVCSGLGWRVLKLR